MAHSSPEIYPKLLNESVNMDFERCHLEHIPDDVVYEILTFIDPWLILSTLIRVSKQFYRIARNRIEFSLTFEKPMTKKRFISMKASNFLRNITSCHLMIVSDLIHKHLTMMKNLQKLIASQIDLVNIEKITSLKHLELQNAFNWPNFNSTSPFTFSQLNQLTYLELNDCKNIFNKEEENHPDLLKSIADLPKLESLILNNCQVKSIQVLSHSKQLKKLHLNGNLLKESELEHLVNLSNLTELSLYCNYEYLSHLESLSKISQLTWLNIGKMNFSLDVSTIDFSPLAKLKELKYLNISENNIEAKQVYKICALKNLTHLDISFNKIGDEGAMILSKSTENMCELTSLDISSNGISNEGVESLKKLKNLKIIKNMFSFF